MYPSIDELINWAAGDDQRPLVMCEYSHAMGNSNGSLHDYWAAIDAHVGLHGGFIWDWIDQGLTLPEPDEQGAPVFGYGGHFGDVPNDADFCINGLIGPDRTPHPAMAEVAKMGEPVLVTARNIRRCVFRLKSRSERDASEWLDAKWSLLVDGIEVDSGPIDLSGLGPHGDLTVEPAVTRPGDLLAGQECHLDISFTTSSASLWAPKGHTVGWSQFALPWKSRTKPAVDADATIVRPEVDRGEDATTVSAGSVAVVIEHETGLLTSIDCGGDQILVEPPQLDLWRAPVQNDGALVGPLAGVMGVATRWFGWGLDRLERTCQSVSIRRSGDSVKIVSSHHLVGADPALVIAHRQAITVEPDGRLVFDEQVRIPTAWDDLPRVGIRIAFSPEMERLEWLGVGPHETYPDRHLSGRFGRYTSTVGEQDHPYVVPQEHGSHTETRWFGLGGIRTPKIKIGSDHPFNFSASHLDDTELTTASIRSELRRRPETIVHIDTAMRGVGTGACGPDTLPTYRVGGGTHRWSWWLTSR